MGERVKTTVRILHREYTLSGGGSPEDLQAAATLVDELVQRLASSTIPDSASALSVLAAINLAHELLKMRQRLQQMEDDSRQLLELLTDPGPVLAPEMIGPPPPTRKNPLRKRDSEPTDNPLSFSADSP